MHGYFKQYDQQGTLILEGEYVDGYLKTGTLYDLNGNKQYEGTWTTQGLGAPMLYHGKGKLWWANAEYDGEFQKGLFCGKGTLRLPDQVSYLEGEFKDNKAVTGLVWGPEGKIYEGEFGPGDDRYMWYYEGQGTLYRHTGIYQGAKGNYPDGYGKYYKAELPIPINHDPWPCCVLFYEGNWKSNVFEGHGKLFDLQEKVTFDGYFENGHATRGKVYYQSGELMYDGELKTGRPCGLGTLYFVNGQIQYEGRYDGTTDFPSADYTSFLNLAPMQWHEGLKMTKDFIIAEDGREVPIMMG